MLRNSLLPPGPGNNALGDAPSSDFQRFSCCAPWPEGRLYTLIYMYFTDLDLNEDLLDALYDMRFDVCTPIQEQCIPHILEGRDVIGIAQTGTGKTAAYLLPLLTLLREQPHPEEAVNCLIMAPTRELARQIDQSLQGFGYYLDINGVAIYGGNDGVRYEQERRSLSRGADVVIATPGRLITHMNMGCLDLSKTTHLVLDEADRMLDMGFYDDIMKIVEQMPKERQTILFSATMPDKIAMLSRSLMHDPVEISIATSKPAEKIDQGLYLCRESDKTKVIQHIFAANPPERVIVFASSKAKVKELHLQLLRKGFNAAAMHSDLEQTERDKVMLDFKARRIGVLVATDIVARGIDIDDIEMVINYDAPRDAEEYVHRIGRTARAGKAGKAITLIGERDGLALKNIEKLMELTIPRLELPEGLKAPEMEEKGKGRRNNDRRNRSNGKRSGRDGKKEGKPAAAPAADSKAAPAGEPSADKASAGGEANKRRRRNPRRSAHGGAAQQHRSASPTGEGAPSGQPAAETAGTTAPSEGGEQRKSRSRSARHRGGQRRRKPASASGEAAATSGSAAGQEKSASPQGNPAE